MGSTRLPGKVMKSLRGRTVLDHVLTRCRAVAGADVVVCATTTGPEDDVVAAAAGALGCEVFRGSVRDVLGRYREAARAVGADAVLRVTSDCPLIDPAVCGEVIRHRVAHRADFCDNNSPRTFPHGLDCEVFSRELLERAAADAVWAYDREHVSPWMRRQPDVARVTLHNDEPASADCRWTLDHADDFTFLRALFDVLPMPAEALPWTFVRSVIDKSVHLQGLAEKAAARAAGSSGPASAINLAQ